MSQWKRNWHYSIMFRLRGEVASVASWHLQVKFQSFLLTSSICNVFCCFRERLLGLYRFVWIREVGLFRMQLAQWIKGKKYPPSCHSCSRGNPCQAIAYQAFHKTKQLWGHIVIPLGHGRHQVHVLRTDFMDTRTALRIFLCFSFFLVFSYRYFLPF